MQIDPLGALLFALPSLGNAMAWVAAHDTPLAQVVVALWSSLSLPDKVIAFSC